MFVCSCIYFEKYLKNKEKLIIFFIIHIAPRPSVFLQFLFWCTISAFKYVDLILDTAPSHSIINLFEITLVGVFSMPTKEDLTKVLKKDRDFQHCFDSDTNKDIFYIALKWYNVYKVNKLWYFMQAAHDTELLFLFFWEAKIIRLFFQNNFNLLNCFMFIDFQIWFVLTLSKVLWSSVHYTFVDSLSKSFGLIKIKIKSYWKLNLKKLYVVNGFSWVLFSSWIKDESIACCKLRKDLFFGS